MYTARLLGPGQATQRRAVLEDAMTWVMRMAPLGLLPQEAITYVLRAARYQTFPTGTWTVDPTSFEKRVMEIMERANETRPAGVAAYEADEVRAALIERGYRPGELPIVSPAPRPGVVQDKAVSIPTPGLFAPVAPATTAPVAPVVKPEPAPLTFFRRAPAPPEPRPVTRPTVSIPSLTVFAPVAPVTTAPEVPVVRPEPIPLTFFRPAPAPPEPGFVKLPTLIIPGPMVFPHVAPGRTAPALPVVRPEAFPPTFFPPPLASREPGPVTLPVVVPRSAVFPEIPMPTPQKKTSIFLWIAGALALYVLGKADGRPHGQSVRSRRKKPVSGISSLAGMGGATANCGLWQEVESQRTGGLVWRCLKYARACRPGFRCESQIKLPPKKKKQTRVCVESKQVKPTSAWFKVATISRCARFLRVCPEAADVCLNEPFEKPPPSPGHGVHVKSMIRSLAKHLAAERNELEETEGKAFGREILDRGGIRSYRKGREKEEYREIPIFMRRNTGLPMDEMASEMGYETDRELMADIKREYPGIRKTKRRYTADDFMLEAEGRIWGHLDPTLVGGLGQELFPGLRRELVLEPQDVATSDDPLEIHLQRKGWKLKRVSELQASMAEKAVPDFFTGKTRPLTQAEAELQDHIQEFFAKSKAYRESLAARYARPLSAVFLGG